jgi:hypothetical protein
MRLLVQGKAPLASILSLCYAQNFRPTVASFKLLGRSSHQTVHTYDLWRGQGGQFSACFYPNYGFALRLAMMVRMLAVLLPQEELTTSGSAG